MLRDLGRLLGLLLPVCPAFAQSVTNDWTRVECQAVNGRATGFTLETKDGAKLASITLGPRGLWSARLSRRDGPTLLFDDIDTSGTGGMPRLGEDSSIAVTLDGPARWPRVRIDLEIEAFDAAAWEEALGARVPFHYLVATVPGGSLFYQGGALIPSLRVDPYPLSRDRMSGDWDGDWSYAPAMAAYAIPAVGLWKPDESVFVAYDFNHARLSERSSKYIASAYDAEHDAFALVHPYAQKWTELTYPSGPAAISTHFDIIYSTGLDGTGDPNQFVWQRLFDDMSDLLPPVPSMNDLGWIPEFDGWTTAPGLPRTGFGTALMHPAMTVGLEAVFVEPGATMLGNPFVVDAIEAAYARGDQSAIDLVKSQLEELMLRAERFVVDGDKCIAWSHPLDGRFKEQYGGDKVREYHHPSTFQIGAACLLLYRHEGDERYLEFVDGVFNWARHYKWTRNGVCDLPWAMFSRAGTAAGENFCLSYYHHFLGDPERRERAEEALQLGLMSLYKTLWVYTADPDETDDLSPAFLTQAVNDPWWIGQVTWNECGWFVRSTAPFYVETGDPKLRYLLRGILDHYFVGQNDDGYTYAEDIEIFGEQNDKGHRSAEFDPCHAGNIRRWARPPGDAVARVLMGRRAAMAFCRGTRAVDIDDYAFNPAGGYRFGIVSTLAAPFDIVASAPFRDLRGLAVCVNGEEADGDRVEANLATAGEDVYIRGVRGGDSVTIGRVLPGEEVEIERIRERTEPHGDCRPLAGFLPVDLADEANHSMDAAWRDGAPWRGMIFGRRYFGEVPYQIIDPAANGGRGGLVDTWIAVEAEASAVFVLVGRERGDAKWPTVVVRTSGRSVRLEPDAWTPTDITNGWTLHEWELGRQGIRIDGRVESVDVDGGPLLALTLALEKAEAALTRLDAIATKGEAQKAEAGRYARHVDAAAQRARRALGGKSCRVALLPPHRDLVKYGHLDQAKMERRVEALGRRLGMSSERVSVPQLIDAERFNADRYPIAVYTSGEEYIRTAVTDRDGEAALLGYVADGGVLLCLSGAGTFPFVYPIDRIGEHWVTGDAGIMPDGSGRAIFGTRLGLNITFSGDCGWESPPAGLQLEFRPARGQGKLPSFDEPRPFPPSGDRRWRSMIAAGLPEGAKLEPLVELWDSDGGHRGAGAAFVHMPTGGQVGFAWGRLLDAPEGDPTIVEMLATAVESVAPGRLTERLPSPEQPQPSGPAEPSILLDGSLESRVRYWASGAFDTFSDYGPHSGLYCADLTLEDNGGTSILMTRPMQLAAMSITPNTRYLLTFWAKTVSGRGLVRCNLYGGQGYDFPQVAVEVASDGDWHEYEVLIESGQFVKFDARRSAFASPNVVIPALRIWTLGERQRTYVDDVSLREAGD